MDETTSFTELGAEKSAIAYSGILLGFIFLTVSLINIERDRTESEDGQR